MRDYMRGILYILGGHRLGNCHRISVCHCDLDMDVPPGSISRKQYDLGPFSEYACTCPYCISMFNMITYI